MDKDDEDKTTKPKLRPAAPRHRGRKGTGGKARGAASAGNADANVPAGKSTRAKASAGKPARAKAPAGKKSTGVGASVKESSEARVRSNADPRLSRSLEYGVAILESFSGARRTLGIADIADIVGVSRSTTHRYAMTLVALGYLEQNSSRKYRLARHAADAGGAAIGIIRREVSARAVLEELREQTGHTVSMAVLNGAQVVYIHRLLAHGVGQYLVDHDLGVGAGVPVYCSALGKVLLASISDAERRELLANIKLKPHGPNTIEEREELVAELDRISTREVVVSDEELFAGSRSIAALVPRPRSEHPTAIDVTVPSSAYTVEQLRKQIGPRLKRAAKLISAG